MIYRVGRGLVATVFLMATVAPSGAVMVRAQDSSGKTPIPDAEAQARAEQLIREVYDKEYAGAKTSAERTVLAKKMLDQAREDQGQTANHFVLLRMAQEMAVEAGDAETAIQVVDRMTEVYSLDTMALKRKTLEAVGKPARTKSQFRAIVQQALPLAEAAVVGDDFDSALELCETAVGAAQKAKDYSKIKQIVQRKEEVAELARQYAQIQAARAELQQTPADPKANLAVGRYYCIVKGDWSRGISMLALGGEGDLKAVAVGELRGAASPDAWVALGDGWWDLGQKESAGPTKDSYLARAAFWYRRAAPQLSGLPQTKVETRMGELSESVLSKLNALWGEPESAEDAKTEEAIALGLEWLVRQQREDGSWNYASGSRPGSLAECPVAATSMALVPLLRGGHTHQDGLHQLAVSKGLTYVTRNAKKVGPTSETLAESGANLYGHALATIALCEAYDRTGNRGLREHAQAAVNFVIYAQDPKGGGWRYQPHQAGDTSVTGWQFAALQIAAKAGLRVPPASIALTHRFLNSVQTDEGAYYGYTSPGKGEATTAIGLLCRTYLRGEEDNPALQRGTQWISQVGPSAADVYYNYYATQLMRRRGGESWQAWKPAIRQTLLASQSQQGADAGSWYTPDKYARDAGALYCTAMAIMTLQICKQ